ncbi:MAG: imidazole glycerol phosphate synthase subunit HisH [Candidatus Omnitrophota bacterium]
MRLPRVAIIDYGMGNLYSVRNALAAVGVRSNIVGTPNRLRQYDKLILPGVGAFGDAMKELKKRRLVGPISDFVAAGKPLLGICLGMQLLMEKSEESKGVAGFSIVAGSVRKFSSKLKCPHMGWNEIRQQRRCAPVFGGLRKNAFGYFCHSYYVVPSDPKTVIGKTDYGIVFASMIKKDNVVGMQFHPEKSQEVGLRLLRNFIERC